MITSFAPIIAALATLAAFTFGALFGAWLVDSDTKRRNEAARPLMEIVEAERGAS